MKNYDEANVVRALNKKVGCNVNSVNKTITIDKTSDSLGNRSWGKIDFLVHYCKYVYVFTTSSIRKIVVQEEKEKLTKSIKRENKFNMVSMTKNAMKKAKQ